MSQMNKELQKLYESILAQELLTRSLLLVLLSIVMALVLWWTWRRYTVSLPRWWQFFLAMICVIHVILAVGIFYLVMFRDLRYSRYVVATTKYDDFFVTPGPERLRLNSESMEDARKLVERRIFDFTSSHFYDDVMLTLGTEECAGRMADLALVSPFTHIKHLERNDKPAFLRVVGEKVRLPERCEEGGPEVRADSYSSFAVFGKAACDVPDDIGFDRFVEQVKEKATFVLGPEPSTSTHVIPRIRMVETGAPNARVISETRKEAYSLLRRTVKPNRSSDQCLVAFMSTEDLCDYVSDASLDENGLDGKQRQAFRRDLGYVNLLVGIPNDPIYINQNCGEHRSNRALDKLAERGGAYKYDRKQVGHGDPWIGKHAAFVDYILSAVVTGPTSCPTEVSKTTTANPSALCVELEDPLWDYSVSRLAVGLGQGPWPRPIRLVRFDRHLHLEPRLAQACYGAQVVGQARPGHYVAMVQSGILTAAGAADTSAFKGWHADLAPLDGSRVHCDTYPPEKSHQHGP